jgi:hypothetical protein
LTPEPSRIVHALITSLAAMTDRHRDERCAASLSNP